MDGDLAEKIKNFLSDPAAAEKIAAVAQTLGAPSSVQPSTPPQPQAAAQTVPAEANAAVPASSTLSAAAAAVSGRSRHAQLISALRPLIREDKRSKLDSMERAMTMATLFSGIRKGQR